MNIADLLTAPITDSTDTGEILTAADSLSTADVLGLMNAHGARTGLELLLWDRLQAAHDVLVGDATAHRALAEDVAA